MITFITYSVFFILGFLFIYIMMRFTPGDVDGVFYRAKLKEQEELKEAEKIKELEQLKSRVSELEQKLKDN